MKIDSESVSVLEPQAYSRPGYQQMLLRDGWRIGRLNFTPEFELQTITRLTRNRQKARMLVQFQGAAVLVTAHEAPNGLRFETHRIEPGTTYHIPANTWHTIAMVPGDVVLILERAYPDAPVEYRDFTSADQENWNRVFSHLRQSEVSDGASPRIQIEVPSDELVRS